MAACLCGRKVGAAECRAVRTCGDGRLDASGGDGGNWVKGEGSGSGSKDASRISAGSAMAWRRRDEEVRDRAAGCRYDVSH